MMKVRIRNSGKVRIVDLDGEARVSIGDMSLPELLRELQGQGHNHILLNLAAVPYVDTMAIGEIVQAWKRAKESGGSLKLLQPGEFVANLLELTKLKDVFEIFDDEVKALESF